MVRQHVSFLLRCWQLDQGQQRIEIEHIQSGERRLAHSVADALEWIYAAGMDEPEHVASASVVGSDG